MRCGWHNQYSMTIHLSEVGASTAVAADTPTFIS